MVESIITALLPMAIKLITSWITKKSDNDSKHTEALNHWLKFVESVDYGNSARLKKEADNARERLRERINKGILGE